MKAIRGGKAGETEGGSENMRERTLNTMEIFEGLTYCIRHLKGRISVYIEIPSMQDF
jgi:hypothetical protein